MDYYLFPFFVAILIIPLMGLFIYLQRRPRPAFAGTLSYLLIAILGWMICNTLELVSPTESGALLWAKLTYIFIVAAPVLWLFFILDYLGYQNWLRWPRALGFWVIPLLVLALVFTNEQHHLIWSSYDFWAIGGYLALRVKHGSFYYLQWIYAQILIVLSIGLLLSENFSQVRRCRWRNAWFAAGALSVALVNGIYVSGLFPGWQKDYTPIALAVVSTGFAIGISRYSLLRVAAIGRNSFFESISDAIVATDEDGVIINCNPAAQRLFSIHEEQAIGKPFSTVFPFLPSLETADAQAEKKEYEYTLHDTPPCYLNFEISPIKDQKGKSRGCLILARDITAEKLTQIAERQERTFALALSETAAALNKTRHLDDLLDLIIQNVVRVTSCDSANIMLIDHGCAQAVRSLEAINSQVRLPVAETYNLRTMVDTRQPIVMPDVNDFPGWVDLPETRWIRSYAGAPIIVEDEVVGFINLDSSIPHFYTRQTADRLAAFANHASIAIQNARTYKKFEELATVDGLTGLFNRRHFFALAEKEYARTSRYPGPLSAIMIDLDQFKTVNDTYGHLVGDETLRRVADACRGIIRAADIMGRYGGEEYAILLPETDPHGAQRLADRLCCAIANQVITTSQGNLHVTASLGVASHDPTCTGLEDLLSRADNALYKAKAQGGNCSRIFKAQD